MRLPDSVRRAIRTFLQSWIGTFLGLWALSGIDAQHFAGVSDLKIIGKLVIGAAIGCLPALLSYIQNALEDASGTSFIIAKSNPDPEPTQPKDEVATLVKPEEPPVVSAAQLSPEEAGGDHDDSFSVVAARTYKKKGGK